MMGVRPAGASFYRDFGFWWVQKLNKGTLPASWGFRLANETEFGSTEFVSEFCFADPKSAGSSGCHHVIEVTQINVLHKPCL